MLRTRFEKLIQNADILREEESYGEAIESYQDAVALAKEADLSLSELEVAEINFKIGETAVAAFGIDEAVEVYDSIILAFNDDFLQVARAHYEIGKAYMDDGCWQEAASNMDLGLRFLSRAGISANPYANEARLALRGLLLSKWRAASSQLEPGPD